ncbi:MAG TPA: D-2-hydroxyacid dehydrogenase [Oligoflexia bacterium]|nr:D-2-hydroxyacid dehydrogenase [Oligoflexia bacterium]
MKAKNLLVIVDHDSMATFEKHAARLPGVNIAVEYVGELEQIDKQAAAAEIVLLLCWKPAKHTLQRILQANPKIAWVHTWWAGVDSLIFPELKNYPLILTNARGRFAEPLAEFAIGACIYFAKDFPRLRRNQKAAHWEQFDGGMLAGKTLGIFGYGGIGRSVARRAKGMEMRVLAVRRRIAADTTDANVHCIMPDSALPEMCRESDFIVASAPLTRETQGIFSNHIFQSMKPDAVFVNVGRGPVVDEAALIKALSDGTIKAAALDVFEQEPLDPSSPLWAMENVLISPHCADHYPGWIDHTIDFYVENLERFVHGRPLENVVDIESGY